MWVSLLALTHSRSAHIQNILRASQAVGEWREGDSTQKRLRREEAIAKRLMSKITDKLVYVFAELPTCNSWMRFAWSFRCGYSHPIHFSVHIVKSCRWTEEKCATYYEISALHSIHIFFCLFSSSPVSIIHSPSSNCDLSLSSSVWPSRTFHIGNGNIHLVIVVYNNHAIDIRYYHFFSVHTESTGTVRMGRLSDYDWQKNQLNSDQASIKPNRSVVKDWLSDKNVADLRVVVGTISASVSMTGSSSFENGTWL